MADEFEITITDIAPDGKGIGYYQGDTVLVPYTIPGESLRVRTVRRQADDSILAHGITLLAASGDRITPRCPFFGPGRCGGCQWQHIDYPAQLALKTDIVASALQEATGIKDVPIEMALASPESWAYNVSADFVPTDEGRLGFPATNPENTIAIDECHIIKPEIMGLVADLDLSLDTLTKLQAQVNSWGRRMLVLQTADETPPELEISIPASLNFLLGYQEPFNLIGATHITHRIHGRDFRVTAGVSYRANLPQVERLVELIVSLVEPTAEQMVFDLYGGIGTFSAFIAPQVSHVTYVDSYPPAATDAEFNLADLDNVDIIEGRTDAVLGALVEAGEWPEYYAAILDPTQGLTFKLLQLLKTLQIPVLIYVSDDPDQLAQDAKYLIKQAGYWLDAVHPIDFAPQTAHITSVVAFRKQ